MEDCECLSDEELEAADFFEYKEAKWEDFRGAIIFWLIVAGIVLFGIVPWVVGVIAILRSLLWVV
jgi:hypothetical protein